MFSKKFLVSYIGKGNVVYIDTGFISDKAFLAHTYLELQQNEQAVRIYEGLSNAGLRESTYIMAQVRNILF